VLAVPEDKRSCYIHVVRSWGWSIASQTQSRRRRHFTWRHRRSSSNPSFLPIPAIVGYKPVSGRLSVSRDAASRRNKL